MNSNDVGRALVDLCKQGKNLEAVDTLFAADVVSEEAMESPAMSRVMKGIEAVRGKNQWWIDNHEIHGQVVTGPFPNGDEFAVTFAIDCTAKAGPMTGQRMTLQEVALYTVKDGKIVREKFFYSMG